MRADTILDTIGRTPHVRIRRLFGGTHEVWMKLERANPGGSIKDRIALSMIEDAERRGLIRPGETLIVEPTSGNTGIGLAMVAAVKGYELTLVMPETMSVERRRVMTAYGARLELTPKEGGIRAAIARAEAIRDERGGPPKAWIPQQFENPSNVEVHQRTTAREILDDFPDGVDVLITGVGTGGHISGVSEVLKQHWPRLRTFAVEPEKSQPIAGGTHTPHKLQGIGTGFVPTNLHRETLDGTIAVSEEAAFEMAQRAAREEGIFIGLSSGASLAAVRQKLPELEPGTRVLTFCYDTGERYLSIEGLFPVQG
jgi:cysteine synthase